MIVLHSDTNSAEIAHLTMRSDIYRAGARNERIRQGAMLAG